jgi:hypothetical protein
MYVGVGAEPGECIKEYQREQTSLILLLFSLHSRFVGVRMSEASARVE